MSISFIVYTFILSHIPSLYLAFCVHALFYTNISISIAFCVYTLFSIYMYMSLSFGVYTCLMPYISVSLLSFYVFILLFKFILFCPFPLSSFFCVLIFLYPFSKFLFYVLSFSVSLILCLLCLFI